MFLLYIRSSQHGETVKRFQSEAARDAYVRGLLYGLDLQDEWTPSNTAWKLPLTVTNYDRDHTITITK